MASWNDVLGIVHGVNYHHSWDQLHGDVCVNGMNDGKPSNGIKVVNELMVSTWDLTYNGISQMNGDLRIS